MRDVPFDFDVDKYINRFIPRSRLDLLPTPISWFLGHRSHPRAPIGSVIVWFWSFFGAFCGILVVEAVFDTQALQSHGSVLVIGSFGASAILEYNTIESPLSQPRNVILGQTFAAIIGTSITKLFQYSSNFEGLRWIAGALAVGVTSAVMGMTKTIHPPAGATALLAATSNEITDLGWFLIALVLIGSCLMLGVACIINNIQRTFPVYWWTPADLSRRPTSDPEKAQGVEKDEQFPSEERLSYAEQGNGNKALIVIDGENVSVPDWVSLDAEEKAMLQIFRGKLQAGLRATSSRGSEATHVPQ